MEDQESGERTADQQPGDENDEEDPARAADLAVALGLDLLYGGEAGVQLQGERCGIRGLRGRLAEEFFYLVFHFSRYSLTCLRPRVR